MKKIAIYTEALGPISSGGIRCIVYFLNILKDRGYDVCAFVDVPPFNSTWLPSKFEVYSSNSKEYESFDEVLISPYSPTAKRVSEHKNAKHRIHWCHTFEGAFEHNGPQWMKQAVDSYRLKNISYMATSHYVKIMLELIFKQKVLPHLVPGGVDKTIFKYDDKLFREKIQRDKLTFCMLNRPESLRGIDIGLQAFNLLKKDFGDKVELGLFAGLPQDQMYTAYGFSHFFIDPSLLAGLPLPPLEAMSCGCVPIVTHFGTTDYIRDEINGFLINANDIQDTYRVLKFVTEKYFSSKEKTNEGLNLNETLNDWYEERAIYARLESEKWTWEHMVDAFEKNLEIL